MVTKQQMDIPSYHSISVRGIVKELTSALTSALTVQSKCGRSRKRKFQRLERKLVSNVSKDPRPPLLQKRHP